jgi:hypothetical protein
MCLEFEEIKVALVKNAVLSRRGAEMEGDEVSGLWNLIAWLGYFLVV